GDVAHLVRQVVRHAVDVLGEALPRARDARHVRLTAQHAFRSDLARHTNNFAGEAVELIDHLVDGVLELENLAAYVDVAFSREVAVGDGCRHNGDVANLTGQVRGHEVHVLRQVLPCAGDTGNIRLSAQLPLGAHLTRHASHLGCKRRELIHHRV